MSDAEPGNPSSLAEEAESVRQWLTRYFRRRVRNDSEIVDMIQDVFMRMLAHDSPDPIEHLGGYVLKTASSVLTDWMRRRSSHRAGLHVAFEPEIHGKDQIDPERILQGKERLRAATLVLLRLPERTRTVFILRRLEGERFQDIAKRLGISVSAVEKHMVRAIRELSFESEKRSGS